VSEATTVLQGDKPLQELIGKHVYWFLTKRTGDLPKAKRPKEKAKLAERLFCTLRFRRGDNFIDQFRSLFFGCPQFNAIELATALMHETETVKTLTLAALAEQMYLPKSENAEGAKK
jgi:hypothetical protein